jgi:tRNA pseudouridine-54 N-methylase
MRRFAVVGHRAMAKGKLPLNDLAGGAGRMDVLIRATMAGLLTSHGLRNDTIVVLHLLGGPGPPRRIQFDGASLRGIHAEERSIAGTIGKITALPLPPIGRWDEVSPGLSHSGGNLSTTLREWAGTTTVVLDADAPRLWSAKAILPTNGLPHDLDLTFVLSDDLPLEPTFAEVGLKRSLGHLWLQGHMAVGVVHFLLDEGVELNLG